MAVVEEIPLAAAVLAGHAHASCRRAGGPREAVLPDLLIGHTPPSPDGHC
jgi:hypothetical protein